MSVIPEKFPQLLPKRRRSRYLPAGQELCSCVSWLCDLRMSEIEVVFVVSGLGFRRGDSCRSGGWDGVIYKSASKICSIAHPTDLGGGSTGEA
jgi:hypothetical protein